MSKPAPSYLPAEFPLPKVQGLAVHNAKKATDIASDEYGDSPSRSLTVPPPEVQSYCLFGVRNDCSVFPLASGPTTADMAPIVNAKNLRALADKYKLIGFVHAKQPKRAKVYEVLQVPKGGRK